MEGVDSVRAAVILDLRMSEMGCIVIPPPAPQGVVPLHE